MKNQTFKITFTFEPERNEFEIKFGEKIISQGSLKIEDLQFLKQAAGILRTKFEKYI